MTLSGELVVGSRWQRSSETFLATAAQSAQPMQPPFHVADADTVAQACESAWAAFDEFRNSDIERRAQFLETIAEQILALGDALLTRASAESGLPLARLTGERGRTVGQLRLFASELRSGGWLGVRIDPALPDRQPLPRPELRQYRAPLGPVAIFGASNFPLAFSVAGGDTAAALAAGCPVVVKGHPAHPGTSELVARAIVAAIEICAMPRGVFSLLNGASNAIGAALVADPRIKAVGFTGSRAGGLALMKIAAERAEPIPVYAEMSSINPVVLLPAALAVRGDALAAEFVGSLTMGSGQFCTNPGLLLAIKGPALDRFIAAASTALTQISPTVMLTPGIRAAYESGVGRLQQHAHTQLLARGNEPDAPQCGRAALFAIDAAALMQYPELGEEVFGPLSVLVRCNDQAELLRALQKLEGQLTATLHFVEQDHALVRTLLSTLEGKVGRVIANSWPTGVEVSHAMVHGGPFPATSDGRSTSVGTLAIERFLRPVCYQDFPESLLPAALQQRSYAVRPHRHDGAYRSGRADGNGNAS